MWWAWCAACGRGRAVRPRGRSEPRRSIAVQPGPHRARNRILVVRRADGVTAQQFDDALSSAVTSGFRLGTFDATSEDRPAIRTTHTLAVGLSLFALIASSVLVVNQAVTRHVTGTHADHPALNALDDVPATDRGSRRHRRTRCRGRGAGHGRGQFGRVGMDAGRARAGGSNPNPDSSSMPSQPR